MKTAKTGFVCSSIEVTFPILSHICIDIVPFRNQLSSSMITFLDICNPKLLLISQYSFFNHSYYSYYENLYCDNHISIHHHYV